MSAIDILLRLRKSKTAKTTRLGSTLRIFAANFVGNAPKRPEKFLTAQAALRRIRRRAGRGDVFALGTEDNGRDGQTATDRFFVQSPKEQTMFFTMSDEARLKAFKWGFVTVLAVWALLLMADPAHAAATGGAARVGLGARLPRQSDRSGLSACGPFDGSGSRLRGCGGDGNGRGSGLADVARDHRHAL